MATPSGRWGSPATSLRAASTGASVTMETYFVSFQNLNFGQGYALSLLVALVTVALSLLVIRFIYRKVEL